MEQPCQGKMILQMRNLADIQLLCRFVGTIGKVVFERKSSARLIEGYRALEERTVFSIFCILLPIHSMSVGFRDILPLASTVVKLETMYVKV